MNASQCPLSFFHGPEVAVTDCRTCQSFTVASSWMNGERRSREAIEGPNASPVSLVIAFSDRFRVIQTSASSIIRQRSRTYASALTVSTERPPCFHALRLFLGAPLPLPPCIRHRLPPFTAGDWHSIPERVRARQRGACASRSGCMGLFA